MFTSQTHYVNKIVTEMNLRHMGLIKREGSKDKNKKQVKGSKFVYCKF